MSRIAQVLAPFLAKSGGRHGEGSRGGHVIGHTRGGKPIYAHASADKKDVRPLVEGNKYGTEHFLYGAPGAKETHLAEHLYMGPSFSDGDREGAVPLGNGHHLAFETKLLSHGSSGGRVYVEPGNPLSYEDPGEPPSFETTHAIVDNSGKKVEGAELTGALKHLADETNYHLSQRAEENYDPGDYGEADNGADAFYDDLKDREMERDRE